MQLSELPPIGSSVRELCKFYEKTQMNLAIENEKIEKKKNDIFRVLTYNVHWWSDCEMNENTKEILSCIEKCEADILVIEVISCLFILCFFLIF